MIYWLLILAFKSPGTIRVAFNRPTWCPSEGQLVHDFTIWFRAIGPLEELHVARIDVTCPSQDFHVTIIRQAWQTFSDHIQKLLHLDCVRLIFNNRPAALKFRYEYAREFRSLGEAEKVAFGWREVISGRKVYLFHKYEQTPRQI